MSNPLFLGLIRWKTLVGLLALAAIGRLAHDQLSPGASLPLIDTGAGIVMAIAAVAGLWAGLRRAADPEARVYAAVRQAIAEPGQPAAAANPAPGKPATAAPSGGTVGKTVPDKTADAGRRVAASRKPAVAPAERRCPSCGRPVAAGKKFCTFDGTRIP